METCIQEIHVVFDGEKHSIWKNIPSIITLSSDNQRLLDGAFIMQLDAFSQLETFKAGISQPCVTMLSSKKKQKSNPISLPFSIPSSMSPWRVFTLSPVWQMPESPSNTGDGAKIWMVTGRSLGPPQYGNGKISLNFCLMKNRPKWFQLNLSTKNVGHT